PRASERKLDGQLATDRLLDVPAQPVIGAEQLVRSRQEPLVVAEVAHVERVRRNLKATILSELELATHSEVHDVQRRQLELTVGTRRVRETDRGRQRIRDNAAVRQRHGRGTELGVGPSDPSE